MVGLRVNKRTLQTLLAKVRRIQTWQLVVVLVIGLVLSASFLRLNSLEMDDRREAVYAADKAADEEQIKASIVELQSYVSSHMNTSLGDGFYLENSYNRARDSALNAATTDTNPNAAVYQQASLECRNRFQGGVESFQNDYVACVAERVRALSPSTDPESGLNLPKADNYRYNFASPVWSPDLAGFTVLFCAIITSVIALRIVSAVVLRFFLKQRFKAV